MSTRNVVPRNDGEGSLGTSLKRWLSGFFNWLNISQFIEMEPYDLERTSDNLFKLFNSSSYDSLTYHINEEVTVNLGQKRILKVYNNTGVELSKGKCVYITGSHSNSGIFATVALAKADNLITARLIGITNNCISNDSFGYVCCSGELHGIDCSSYNKGDSLYLSDTVAGELTNVKPDFTMRVGFVINNVVDGKMLIALQEYGESLGDMLRSVYDTDDDGIVDKAEVLNDGSSGDGNNVTAFEARNHIDGVDNPHNTSQNNIVVPRAIVNDTDFTVLNTHYLISVVELTANRTLSLPTPDGIIRMFIIKDESGKGGLYPITLLPPSGVTICQLSKIDLNITCGSVCFYSDGTNYFIYSSSTNAGQVKINNGNSVKPTFTFNAGNLDIYQQIIYALPLGLSSYPTTRFPKNIDTPVDSDIYDSVNNTFIENTIPGQIQKWRFIISYSGKPTNKSAGVTVKLKNTLSGFVLASIITIPEKSASGFTSTTLTTIADSVSLPSPFGTGQGYVIEIVSDTEVEIIIESVTRISDKAD